MLSPTLQAMLRPLRVHMSAEANMLTQERISGKPRAFANEDRRTSAIQGNFHPLVRTHPFTGLPSLYVDEAYAVGIEGLTEEESRPILAFLTRHIPQAGFTCRLRREPGMIARRDNRAAPHPQPDD